MRNRIEDRFIDALRQLDGGYAFVALTNDKLIGARDPWGLRPLVLGEIDGSPVLCSETCALDAIGASFVRNIEAGEVVVIDKNGVESLTPFPARARHAPACSNTSTSPGPTRIMHGQSVYETRQRFGRVLAREAHVDADLDLPGARWRQPGGARLCRSFGHSLRLRHHPQPLCRPHLHPADADGPPALDLAQARAEPSRSSKASASCWSTTPSCAATPRSASCR